jgi:hypothetical protein
MAESDGEHSRPQRRPRTELFSDGEIEALKHELTALQDIIGAIQASERLLGANRPEWKRKSVIIEKLQKENRRVLEVRAKLDRASQLWRDVRARTSEATPIKEPT